MRRNLEDYRPEPTVMAAGRAGDDKPRMNFLGVQQDTALGRRAFGGLFVTALLLAASTVLFG